MIGISSKMTEILRKRFEILSKMFKISSKVNEISSEMLGDKKHQKDPHPTAYIQVLKGNII